MSGIRYTLRANPFSGVQHKVQLSPRGTLFLEVDFVVLFHKTKVGVALNRYGKDSVKRVGNLRR